MLRQARGTAAVAVLSCFLPLCSSDAHLSTGDDGVWWDSSVVQMERLANGARFFRVKDRFGLMVADAPQGFIDASLKHFGDCEASQWQAMSSFTTDTQRSAPAAYTCLHQRLLADKLLATFNADPSLARALRKSFNVSAPCKHREGRTDPKLGGSWIRNHVLYHLHPRFRGTRSWGSLLDEHTAPDAFHADGFEQLRRPAGADFFTVLHYPGDPKWADGWGGEFLLSAHAQLSGGEQREESERLVGMDGAVVRVARRGARQRRGRRGGGRAARRGGPPRRGRGGHRGARAGRRVDCAGRPHRGGRGGGVERRNDGPQRGEGGDVLEPTLIPELHRKPRAP